MSERAEGEMSETGQTPRERCEAIVEDALDVKARHGHGVGATPGEVLDAILAELREADTHQVRAVGREAWSAAIDAIAREGEK